MWSQCDGAGIWRTLPAELREALQGLPLGYTAIGALREKVRSRLLGNAWHADVATFLLSFIHTAERMPAPSDPCLSLSPWGSCLLDRITILYHVVPPLYDLPSKPARMGSSALPEQQGPLSHLRAARGLIHPDYVPALPEFGYRWAVLMLRELGPDIVQWRTRMCDELTRPSSASRSFGLLAPKHSGQEV